MSLTQKIKKISKLKGRFELRSGAVSDTYFDKYRFESDPQILAEIAKEMSSLIPENTEYLCGLEMGGIPVVTMLSHYSRIPAAFVRKQAKQYGTCQYAEGADLKGKKIILVEDVVSSGGAIIDAAEKFRADGIEVNLAICVIDRESGGKEMLQEAGIELKSLLTATALERA